LEISYTMTIAPALLDNTVLTNFALVGRPDIVLRLWPDIACTTPAVRSEYQAGATAGLTPGETWADLPAVALTEAEATFAAELPPRLGMGERTCLAVAVHRHGLLASDDQDARTVARRYGVPVTGTLGILVLGIRHGHLARDEADALLKEMIAAGYRSPVTNLDELFRP
jgi:predicted nucleic acid-binding protein